MDLKRVGGAEGGQLFIFIFGVLLCMSSSISLYTQSVRYGLHIVDVGPSTLCLEHAIIRNNDSSWYASTTLVVAIYNIRYRSRQGASSGTSLSS